MVESTPEWPARPRRASATARRRNPCLSGPTTPRPAVPRLTTKRPQPTFHVSGCTAYSCIPIISIDTKGWNTGHPARRASQSTNGTLWSPPLDNCARHRRKAAGRERRRLGVRRLAGPDSAPWRRILRHLPGGSYGHPPSLKPVQALAWIPPWASWLEGRRWALQCSADH